ncbi:DUF4126 domain-containing protein [Xanthomonas codiaei]|nr:MULTISPECIES: membrane protein [Xanthomonas]MCC4619097.1 DUF4126 domain-containing protein [Xanthomonas cassavae CFBP 4642]MCC8538409.1 DUF4126 domain-containing protein [Xanthomonas codiaei]MEA5126278.1 DUF4126 domain-containing protein [Xanthomonas floridensis]MEA5134262.1 DUF4126 domain-containing protein [Xanthomonas floridensis]OAG67115.1 hypothetical protein A7D17_18970 [Xanthomonas floridensis]
MALIHSILMGAVAGMRSMTPLAAVTNAARSGKLPRDNGAPRLLANPLASAGMLALASGEIAGDKMKTAPDRIVLPGMIARVATGMIAGAALAPRHQRGLAAVLGATAAVGAAYLTFNLRMRAIERYGQTSTGAVEDAISVGAAALIVRSAAEE